MTRRPTSATLLGKRYRLRWVTNLTDPRKVNVEKIHGDSDPPDSKHKSIRILLGQTPEDEMDTIIHEFLHAADWHRAEDWVARAAGDLTRLLRRCGYRRQDEAP